MYFVHVGTGGPFACGDNLIGIGTGIAPTGDIEVDIEHALNALFSAGQYSGEFYNATYRSSLKASADVLSNGKIRIQLSGTFVKPDNDCDIMRYREQVWQTVRQIAQGKDFDIYLGPKLLGDRLYTGK